MNFESPVTVEGLKGFEAPKLEINNILKTIPANVLPKHAQSAHIKGTLKLVELPRHTLVTVASRVGIQNQVNGEDIIDIHENCAWLSAPSSLPDINSGSTITFTAKKTEFYDAKIEKDIDGNRILVGLSTNYKEV